MADDLVNPIKGTPASRMIKFIETYCKVPEGPKTGQAMELLPEQRSFITRVFNNRRPDGKLRTRTAIKSIARKNGKTAEISNICQAYLMAAGFAKQNANIYSAAQTRDQAALLFNYMAKSIRLNPKLEGLIRIVDSRKEIHGLVLGTKYRALSADAPSAHGLSPNLVVFDESGQIVGNGGSSGSLVEALETSFGGQDEPLSMYISTQAASDSDFFSVLIDDAIRSNDPSIVLDLYTLPNDADIYDEKNWYKTNYALGKHRSLDEFRDAAAKAKRLPSFENSFKNLYLNMRVSMLSLYIAASTWKKNAENRVEEEAFFTQPVHCGLDLSARNDLTAATLAAADPETGIVHLRSVAFTPLNGLEERAKRDKAPYVQWVKEGSLIALPGNVIDYLQVAEYLRDLTAGMNLVSINYDRWRIDLFKENCARIGFAQNGVVFEPVGQGYRDFSPRLETFETLLANNLIAHGDNPVLNAAASNAVAVMDAAGNKKIDKSKTSARIDPLVATVMAVHAAVAPPEAGDAPVVHTASAFFV